MISNTNPNKIPGWPQVFAKSKKFLFLVSTRKQCGMIFCVILKKVVMHGIYK